MSDFIYECDGRIWRTDAEGKRLIGWVRVPVLTALQMAERPDVRCWECHGRVRLHRAGPYGTPAAHAEHQKKNPGCSLGFCFDGEHRMHYDRIE